MNHEFKLVSADGSLVCQLSGEALASLVYALPNTKDMSDFYLALAKHPDSRVRENLAAKEHLPEEAVYLLAKDSSIDVVLAVVRNYCVREFLSIDDLMAVCRADPKLASEIAQNVETYANADSQIMEYLESHPDSAVRQSLANNRAVFTSLRRRMAKNDPDSGVRNAAST